MKYTGKPTARTKGVSAEIHELLSAMTVPTVRDTLMDAISEYERYGVRILRWQVPTAIFNTLYDFAAAELRGPRPKPVMAIFGVEFARSPDDEHYLLVEGLVAGSNYPWTFMEAA